MVTEDSSDVDCAAALAAANRARILSCRASNLDVVVVVDEVESLLLLLLLLLL